MAAQLYYRGREVLRPPGNAQIHSIKNAEHSAENTLTIECYTNPCEDVHRLSCYESTKAVLGVIAYKRKKISFFYIFFVFSVCILRLISINCLVYINKAIEKLWFPALSVYVNRAGIKG